MQLARVECKQIIDIYIYMYIYIYLCTLPHTHLGINLKFINTSTMQLARVIRLSVNKSYQFIILKVRRARAAVFTLYVQSSNLHIKSCRQCYCARWCIQTSPEVRWNYSVRHLPNVLSLQFLVLLWKIMFQVTIWAWTNHIDLSILHQLGARVPDTYHCTAPRAYARTNNSKSCVNYHWNCWKLKW